MTQVEFDALNVGDEVKILNGHWGDFVAPVLVIDRVRKTVTVQIGLAGPYRYKIARVEIPT